MKWLRFTILLGGFLLLLPTSAKGQTLTQVSATIVDPNGLPYSNASVSFAVLPASGGGATPSLTPCSAGPGSCPVLPPTQGFTDILGHFVTTLPANGSILPAGTTWQFTVGEPGVSVPWGTGSQTIVYAVTITGATQDLSSALSSLAPALTHTLQQSAPNMNAVYLSPNCGTQTNCVPVSNVAQLVVDGAYSGSGTTITSVSAKFAPGDVGHIMWCNSASSGGYAGGANIVPVSTIVSYNSASSVSLSTFSAAATSNMICVWGVDNTASFKGAATLAAGASLQPGAGPGDRVPPFFSPYSGQIIFPCGGYIVGGTSPILQIGVSAGSSASIPGFVGGGSTCTAIYIRPDTNTDIATQSLFLSATGFSGLWGRFTLSGAGYAGFHTGGNNMIGVIFFSINNARVEDLTVDSIGMPDGYRTAVGILAFQGGGSNSIDRIKVGEAPPGDGNAACGFNFEQGDKVTKLLCTNNKLNLWIQNGIPLSQAASISISDSLIDESCAVGAGASTLIASTAGYVSFSTDTFWSCTGDLAMEVQSGAIVDLHDNQYIGPYTTRTNASGIQIDAGATVYSKNNGFYSTGTGVAVNNAGLFFDNGGNAFNGTVTNTGGWFGSASVTGTAQTALNITASSGWDTNGTAGDGITAVAGDSHKEYFTVSGAGGSGRGPLAANPSVTIVFPTPFQVPPICSAQDLGGTGIFASISLDNTLNTTTSTSFIWNGTPTASQTYEFVVSCQ